MTKAEMDIKKKVELHEQKKIESMKSTKYYYKQTDALWLGGTCRCEAATSENNAASGEMSDGMC